LRVSTRNARFQQWQALLSSRAKRHRAGEFLVHGVRPITLAISRGWPIRAMIYAAGRPLSAWAARMLGSVDAVRVAMAPGLVAELAEKDDGAPELIAVAGVPEDRLDRIHVGPGFLGLVLDRMSSPGNIGTLVRSADAFAAAGVIVAGHAADVFDPKAVRASTGSIFALPVVRVPSHREVADWVAALRAGGVPLRLVGTDETGPAELGRYDLTGPSLIIVGSEAAGLSAAWRSACDDIVRIPIGGSASSLNAAAAGTVMLYEAARQRRSQDK